MKVTNKHKAEKCTCVCVVYLSILCGHGLCSRLNKIINEQNAGNGVWA